MMVQTEHACTSTELISYVKPSFFSFNLLDSVEPPVEGAVVVVVTRTY